MVKVKHSKKRGFTLIEMLIVIVIIGILAAYLIPRISSAQGKARDVGRKSDIRQLYTALTSYQMDHGKYPVLGEGGCVTELTGLTEGHYIDSIAKDPARKSAGVFCTSGEAYGYISDGYKYMIVSAVDEPTSANYCNGTGSVSREQFTTIKSAIGTGEGTCTGENSLYIYTS